MDSISRRFLTSLKFRERSLPAETNQCPRSTLPHHRSTICHRHQHVGNIKRGQTNSPALEPAYLSSTFTSFITAANAGQLFSEIEPSGITPSTRGSDASTNAPVAKMQARNLDVRSEESILPPAGFLPSGSLQKVCSDGGCETNNRCLHVRRPSADRTC